MWIPAWKMNSDPSKHLNSQPGKRNNAKAWEMQSRIGLTKEQMCELMRTNGQDVEAYTQKKTTKVVWAGEGVANARQAFPPPSLKSQGAHRRHWQVLEQNCSSIGGEGHLSVRAGSQ